MFHADDEVAVLTLAPVVDVFEHATIVYFARARLLAAREMK